MVPLLKNISGHQLRGTVPREEGCTEQKAGRPAAPGPPPTCRCHHQLLRLCLRPSNLTSRQPASGSNILVTKRKKICWAALQQWCGRSHRARWLPLVFRLPGERDNTGPSTTKTVVATLPGGDLLWFSGAVVPPATPPAPAQGCG